MASADNQSELTSVVEAFVTSAEGVRAPLIEMRGITKRYGETVADDNVDLTVTPGEIHVLLGENGAGKTTLMEILYGFVPMDSGEIVIDGAMTHLSSPHDALIRGIGMVHQQFMLVPSFTVAENAALGMKTVWGGRFDRSGIVRDVQAAADKHGLHLDAGQRCRDLGADGQQRVEILRLLYRGAKVLVLDEPTASLGPAQIASLFQSLKTLSNTGHSILMVTHKLREVAAIADRVTVLRHGRLVMRALKGEFDEHSLAVAMTGGEIPKLEAKTTTTMREDEVLGVRELVVEGTGRADGLRGVSLSVGAGEIVGIAGVAGNGQVEIEEAVAGVRPIESGHVSLAGEDVTGVAPKLLHAKGLGTIPSDRRAWALVPEMTLAENLALVGVPAGEFSNRGLLKWRRVRQQAQELLEAYDVRPPNPNLPAHSLSGGNQQKVVLARELGRKPKALIAANPTQGLDIGATAYVHQALLTARAEGSGILLVSQDLDELLRLSDRILVLYRGQFVYERATESITMDDLAMAMAGSRDQSNLAAAVADVGGT